MLLRRTAKSRAGVTPHGFQQRLPIARFRRLFHQWTKPRNGSARVQQY
jgi:hypothetical protein